MRRRDFILSCLLLTSGSILAKTTSFLDLGICMADGMPKLAGTSPIPEKIDDVIESILNGNVLLTKNSHNRILLNDFGTIVWHHIDGKNSCHDISLLLSLEFSINAEMASKDVNSFVFSLKKEGFIDTSKVAQSYVVKKVVTKRKSMSSN